MSKFEPNNIRKKWEQSLKALKDKPKAKEEVVEQTNNFKPWLRDPFSFQSMHKRLAWLLRLSTMMNIALACIVIVLVSLISAMMPLKEVRTALLRVDEAENRVYWIEPISQKVEGFDLLMEQTAKRFVKLILEVDETSQTARLQEAWRFVSDNFYEKFKKERIDSNEIQNAINQGLNRTILVESANLIFKGNNQHRYAVDFIQVDKQKGKEVSRKPLRAFVAMTTRPHEVREKDKYENPLGIRVLTMDLRERGEQ